MGDARYWLPGCRHASQLSVRGVEGDTLKIQILNSSVAVAFAGDAAASCRLIRALHSRITADPTIDPCTQLLALYNDFGAASAGDPLPDCDFLILQLTRRGPKLAKVARDGVLYCKRAHIGGDFE